MSIPCVNSAVPSKGSTQITIYKKKAIVKTYQVIKDNRPVILTYIK